MLPDDEIDELMWSTPVEDCFWGWATIVAIDRRNVWVDIGFKSEAPIPLSEWNEEPRPKVGDKLSVMSVLEIDANVSRFRVTRRRRGTGPTFDWQEVVRQYPVGEVFTGLLVRQIRGGFLVRRGPEYTCVFLPDKWASRQMVESPEAFIGQDVTCRVDVVDDARRNVVVALVANDEATE